MKGDDESLTWIYERTSGYCHICQKKLSYQNYARFGEKGCWEIEHSRPRAAGGSDRRSNLYAACISCNRAKGVATTRTARRHSGTSRAPLSRHKREEAKVGNSVFGGLLGGTIGALLGPLGIAAGAALGAKLAYDQNPDAEHRRRE